MKVVSFLVKSTAPLGSLHFLYFVADFWQGFLVAFATHWTSMLCEGISVYASHGEQLNSICVLIPSFLLHYLIAFWLKFTSRVFLTLCARCCVFTAYSRTAFAVIKSTESRRASVLREATSAAAEPLSCLLILNLLTCHTASLKHSTYV